MALGLRREAVTEYLAHPLHRRDRFTFTQNGDSRDRRRHRGRREPERARREDLGGALAEPVVAEHGRQRIAVGDRLAPGTEIGSHTERLPAAAEVETKARAHVVDDECGVARVAERAEPLRECRRRQLLVDAVVVPEGGHDDPG